MSAILKGRQTGRPLCCVKEDGKQCQELSDVLLCDEYELCWHHYCMFREDILNAQKIFIKEEVEFT